jgi:hypothetical protein
MADDSLHGDGQTPQEYLPEAGDDDPRRPAWAGDAFEGPPDSPPPAPQADFAELVRRWAAGVQADDADATTPPAEDPTPAAQAEGAAGDATPDRPAVFDASVFDDGPPGWAEADDAQAEAGPPDDFVRFVNALFEPDDLIVVRPVESWVQDGKKKSRVVGDKVLYVTAKDFAAFAPSARKWLDEVGETERANIYFGVCPRHGEDAYNLASQIRTVRELWTDTDNCSVEEARRRCAEKKVPPPRVVNSGSGCHLHWRLDVPYLIDDVPDPNPVVPVWELGPDGRPLRDENGKCLKPKNKYVVAPDGRLIYEKLEDGKLNPEWNQLSPKAQYIQDLLGRLAQGLGGDHATDLARLLRLPGTLNRKGQRCGQTPKPCTLVPDEAEVRPCSLAEFERLFPAGPPAEEKKEKPEKAAPPPGDVQANGPPRPPASGRLTDRQRDRLDCRISACRTAQDRSKADFALCCFAVEEGLDQETVWAEVQDVSKFAERGRPYFDSTWTAAERHTRPRGAGAGDPKATTSVGVAGPAAPAGPGDTAGVVLVNGPPAEAPDPPKPPVRPWYERSSEHFCRRCLKELQEGEKTHNFRVDSRPCGNLSVCQECRGNAQQLEAHRGKKIFADLIRKGQKTVWVWEGLSERREEIRRLVYNQDGGGAIVLVDRTAGGRVSNVTAVCVVGVPLADKTGDLLPGAREIPVAEADDYWKQTLADARPRGDFVVGPDGMKYVHSRMVSYWGEWDDIAFAQATPHQEYRRERERLRKDLRAAEAVRTATAAACGAGEGNLWTFRGTGREIAAVAACLRDANVPHEVVLVGAAPQDGRPDRRRAVAVVATAAPPAVRADTPLADLLNRGRLEPAAEALAAAATDVVEATFAYHELDPEGEQWRTLGHPTRSVEEIDALAALYGVSHTDTDHPWQAEGHRRRLYYTGALDLVRRYELRDRILEKTPRVPAVVAPSSAGTGAGVAPSGVVSWAQIDAWWAHYVLDST